jgi:hypothetical protein
MRSNYPGYLKFAEYAIVSREVVYEVDAEFGAEA